MKSTDQHSSPSAGLSPASAGSVSLPRLLARIAAVLACGFWQRLGATPIPIPIPTPTTPRRPFFPLLACSLALSLSASTAQQPPPADVPPDVLMAPPGFGGPPGFGPGGFGFGPGPGGPGMGQDIKLVDKFDKNSDGWLNTEERKAAKEHLEKQRADSPGRRFGPGGPGGRGFGPPGFDREQSPPTPGPKISVAEAKHYQGKPLYAPDVLRTVFLEFDSPDWEKELETFHGTDVDVPAKLTVDGKTYQDVGIRFRGATTYMMVGTGYKRSLNVSVDMAHDGQNVLGHRTLNLLNSHQDPSFLRTVLSLQVARDYFPAPRANFVKVVINGESWGIYVNAEQFNKDFTKEWFNSTKGARWKVPGNPGGRGGLEYLGEDVAQYKQIYEIKSKDEPKSWAKLMNLCRVLNETPLDQLEQALQPVLDIDGALKFLAWDNALANGDGFWTRASDYNLYLDEQGRFHLVPHDVNETFNTGGGPGGPGGGPGGPGMRAFGPGMFLAPQIISQADTSGDQKVSQEEFQTLAAAWFAKLDQNKKGSLPEPQFTENLPSILPPPQTPAGFGPPPGMQRGFGPAMFIGPALFTTLDANKDGTLSEPEFTATFTKWFADWDTAKNGLLDEESIRDGLNKTLPPPDFAQGPGGFARGERRGPGAQTPAGPGPGGRRGFGPGGGGPGGGGPTLDPLVSAQDTRKALASRLLAVPTLKTRYLGYVRDIAEKWLDWNKLGPVAETCQKLIADELKADTRKNSSYEAFIAAVSGASTPTRTPTPTPALAPSADTPRAPRPAASIKSFAEQRRAFLLNHLQIKPAKE